MKKYNIEKVVHKVRDILDVLGVKYTMLSSLSFVMDNITMKNEVFTKLKNRLCKIFKTDNIREYCKFNMFEGRMYLRFKHVAD